MNYFVFLTVRAWPRFQYGFCYLRLYKVHVMLSNIPDPERPEALEPKPLTESPRIRSEPRCEFRWAHSEYLWCYNVCSITIAKHYQWKIYITITLYKLFGHLKVRLSNWFHFRVYYFKFSIYIIISLLCNREINYFNKKTIKYYLISIKLCEIILDLQFRKLV